jgi:hypothetical protein
MTRVLNMAKEQTIASFSGTGTISLNGAVSPFSTFVARATDELPGSSPWSGIGFVITDNAGNWEIHNDGVLTDAATDTLTRPTPAASSNAGALVNFPANTYDVYSWVPGQEVPGVIVKTAQNSTTTNVASAVDIDYDNTLPAISEGTDSGLSVVIAPESSSNILLWSFSCDTVASNSTTLIASFAVFQDSTCRGIANVNLVGTAPNNITMHGHITSGGTTNQTWTVRFGPNSSDPGTVRILSDSAGSAVYAGGNSANLRVLEVSV